MNAEAVANYMIYLMSDTFGDLTNMKINKLLYFAQGHYLSKYGKPLFDDRIEAWEHGPVVPAVYSAYKSYEDGPINGCDFDLLDEMTEESKKFLLDVARKYGKYTASALRKMTHEAGSPWFQVYRENLLHAEIPLPEIQSYFAGMEELKPTTKHFKESDFIGYRDSDDILVLPKEWDDGEV